MIDAFLEHRHFFIIIIFFMKVCLGFYPDLIILGFEHLSADGLVPKENTLPKVALR